MTLDVTTTTGDNVQDLDVTTTTGDNVQDLMFPLQSATVTHRLFT